MKQSKSVAPDRDARFLAKPPIDAEYTVDGWRILPRPPRWLVLPFAASFGAFSWRDWLIFAVVAIFGIELLVSILTLPNGLPSLWSD